MYVCIYHRFRIKSSFTGIPDLYPTWPKGCNSLTTKDCGLQMYNWVIRSISQYIPTMEVS